MERMNNIKAYIEGLSNEALLNEFENQYMNWTKTGVLEEGIIRTIETKLNIIDEGLHIYHAEKAFKDECTRRFAMMMLGVNQGIKKYRGIVETLKENQSQEVRGDDYDYTTDIKNTKEFITDLKKIKK